jgi:hypothetical protein
VSGETRRYRWRVTDAAFGSDLPPTARYVLLVLALLGDVDTGDLGEHSPSLTLLAQLTGLSRRAVMQALNLLEAKGWLLRDRPAVVDARSKKARTRYLVRDPSSPPPELSGSSRARRAPDGDPARAAGAPELGHVVPLSRAARALVLVPSTTSSGERSRSQRRARPAVCAFCRSDDCEHCTGCEHRHG